MHNQLIELNATSIMILVNVFILFLIFKKFFFEKIRGFMLDRQERISSAIERAQEADAEAKRITQEYENVIADLQKESIEIIKNGRSQAELMAHDIISQAEEDAKHIREDARKTIEIQNMQNRSAVRKEIGTLAVMAAERIMSENLDEEKQEQIIDEVIRQQEVNANG